MAFDLFKHSFPELQITIDDMIAEGDRVAVRRAATDTRTGPSLETAPTQQRISLSPLYIDRLAEGKIEEVWLVRDELGRLKQLGAISE